MGASPKGDGTPTIGIADHRTNGDDNEVEKKMLPTMPASGVAQLAKMALDG
jgi:hypothetical protein